MNLVNKPIAPRDLETFLTVSIPAVSFGGIIIAIALQKAEIIADAGTFAWGCVAGSVLLGYLAYIKPKRDIVSLCAPLYALLIFVVPMEFAPTLLMQVLFAASITILVIRLNWKFGSLTNTKGEPDPMERFLNDYIERLRPQYVTIKRKTAHEIASAFLAFKFGLYNNAVHECDLALTLIPNGECNDALKKALIIVRANAQDLDNAQVTPDLSVIFAENERPFIAVNLPPEKIEDPGTLELDNALVLLYAVATLTSPDDEQALDEHRKFVIKLLSAYKMALGLV